MSENLLTSAWAPGVIGLAVANLMYGVTLGQSIYYARCFRDDSRFVKSLVFVVFLADTGHMIGSSQFFWFMVGWCHRNHSWQCTHDIPWGGMTAIWLNYVLTFTVECFYCHRIWIISGKNKPITGTLLVLAFLGFVAGTWCYVSIVKDGTIEYVLTTPLIIPLSGLSSVCDFLITGVIVKYMWGSGFRRHRSVIQDLAVVFINMGVFTCVISLIVGVVYLVQGDHYWVIAVGIVLSRSELCEFHAGCAQCEKNHPRAEHSSGCSRNGYIDNNTSIPPLILRSLVLHFEPHIISTTTEGSIYTRIDNSLLYLHKAYLHSANEAA